MSPLIRRRAALALIIVSIIAWPALALTLAKDEPPVVLALSFLAITISALDVWVTTDVRAEQDDNDNNQ